GPKGAEAAVVVRAWGEFSGGVDVQVKAFVAVGAVEGAGVLVAFGHTAAVGGRIVLVMFETLRAGSYAGGGTLSGMARAKSVQIIFVKELALIAFLA
ncbi:MAG: hypothetical protein Q9170_006297, partial [Blastenia crenularia]